MKQLKYKALISDIDGTLIPNNPHANPSEKVIEAVKKASKLIHIGVATSRPYNHAERIINTLNLDFPCIVGGGSQIVDPKTKKILWEKKLENKDVIKVFEYFKEENINAGIMDDQGNLINFDNYKESPLQIWVQGVEPNIANKIVHIVSSIESIAINKVPSYLKGRVALVITNIHATKQHGIFEVAKISNIDTKEIIGIGDGGNDFPLLMACGLKVAMGNAVGELKEIADHIAPSVENDGVADTIERFVLNAEN